jgi:hypothetical protein
MLTGILRRDQQLLKPYLSLKHISIGQELGLSKHRLVVLQISIARR